MSDTVTVSSECAYCGVSQPVTHSTKIVQFRADGTAYKAAPGQVCAECAHPFSWVTYDSSSVLWQAEKKAVSND